MLTSIWYMTTGRINQWKKKKIFNWQRSTLKITNLKLDPKGNLTTFTNSMLEYKFFALVNKACLQDQEVLAQANNTLKTTAFDQGLTGEKNRKKIFFEKKKNFFSRGFYTPLYRSRYFCYCTRFFCYRPRFFCYRPRFFCYRPRFFYYRCRFFCYRPHFVCYRLRFFYYRYRLRFFLLSLSLFCCRRRFFCSLYVIAFTFLWPPCFFYLRHRMFSFGCHLCLRNALDVFIVTFLLVAFLPHLLKRIPICKVWRLHPPPPKKNAILLHQFLYLYSMQICASQSVKSADFTHPLGSW